MNRIYTLDQKLLNLSVYCFLIRAGCTSSTIRMIVSSRMSAAASLVRSFFIFAECKPEPHYSDNDKKEYDNCYEVTDD